ncbi:hypothetical protein KIF53_12960 [Chromobacterium subtsugae]|uniref:Oxygen-regulated invasion protein OrgB n=1 Tax=Chromobacterium subtsugae TaxID=251747 RepID=A0ABS7FEN7_9NEIS|nr:MULTISPECIES: hypothetical protein [Chromobacterium]MBW7565756.1 hypothetical protein [Chromobacterium subtsugae]MBW8288539.1 hypothetical protein [Chromobacterium subtsugae]WSE89850.1 hypothetical protein U6115_13235 [Chromobacterium subtsugae]WVH58221.1 hypothetical protein U6151_13255 [Chromobacterium subtsugae]
MPRDIPIPHRSCIEEGVLIRSQRLGQAARLGRLDGQARQRAQVLLREARREADAIRQQACQEGYRQGMREALGQVAAHLADSRALAEQWRLRLGAEARAMLSAAVDHPDTLLLLLDEWLRAQDGARSDVLTLQLPSRAKALQPRLMALLAEHWPGAIRIDYHSEPRFVMRCADQAAEFEPEQYVESASRQLLQALDGLQEDCRRIAADSLAHLLRERERNPESESAPAAARQGDAE